MDAPHTFTGINTPHTIAFPAWWTVHFTPHAFRSTELGRGTTPADSPLRSLGRRHTPLPRIDSAGRGFCARDYSRCPFTAPLPDALDAVNAVLPCLVLPTLYLADAA